MALDSGLDARASPRNDGGGAHVLCSRMAFEPLTVTIPEPLASQVRAAAQACGLSVQEWVEMVMRKSVEQDQRAQRATQPANTSGQE